MQLTAAFDGQPGIVRTPQDHDRHVDLTVPRLLLAGEALCVLLDVAVVRRLAGGSQPRGDQRVLHS